jgi:hypothetical protein
LFEAFHGFWKWWAQQGTLVNKKSRLLEAKHLFPFFLLKECGVAENKHFDYI